MTKQQALDQLILLSSIESWSFSTKERLPEYIREDLNEVITFLRSVILEEKLPE